MQKQMYDHSNGTTVDTITITLTSAENYYFQLPPISKQKRIVEKIKNAFAKLDEIAEQLA